MAAEVLKKNIDRILKERGWKLQDLERKAGTNRTIHNIFRNKSTNPSVDLIQKIAKALKVGYNELLEEHTESNYIQDPDLLLEAFEKIISEIKKLPKDIEISFETVFLLSLEVYLYTNSLHLKNIDAQFVKWTIMKYFPLDTLKP